MRFSGLTSYCTEIYYILEGWGKMELNDDLSAVEPGMVIDFVIDGS